MNMLHSLVQAEAMCEQLRKDGMSNTMIKQLIFRTAEDSLTNADKKVLRELEKCVNEKIPQTLN